jgi:2-keto-3-deoxy-L-rhamnonate aldolase RhmA
VGHEAVIAAIETVRDACARRQLATGIFSLHAATVGPYLQRGFTLIAAGCDSAFILGGGRDSLEQLQAIPVATG